MLSTELDFGVALTDCQFQAPRALTDLAGMNQDQDRWFQARWAQGHWESHRGVVHLCDRD